jgi:hypothetical protein
MGSSVAVVGAYREKGDISDIVDISSIVGIGASSGKDVFRLYRDLFYYTKLYL